MRPRRPHSTSAPPCLCICRRQVHKRQITGADEYWGPWNYKRRSSSSRWVSGSGQAASGYCPSSRRCMSAYSAPPPTSRFQMLLSAIASGTPMYLTGLDTAAAVGMAPGNYMRSADINASKFVKEVVAGNDEAKRLSCDRLPSREQCIMERQCASAWQCAAPIRGTYKCPKSQGAARPLCCSEPVTVSDWSILLAPKSSIPGAFRSLIRLNTFQLSIPAGC